MSSPSAASNPDALASLANVEKQLGTTAALRGVSFEVGRGEVVALLGANGAGKTTAIEILLGLRRLDRGAVRLMGEAPHELTARKRIGVTPQDSSFPPNLRVREVIYFVRAHYTDPAATEETIERFGLEGIAGRRTGGLSGGERRRLAVALAFVGRPALMFLDEPTVGLDVTSRRAVWRQVRDYVASGGTLLLTTHYLEEAEALASRILVVDRGRIFFSGSVDSVRARIGVKRVSFSSQDLPSLPGIVEQTNNNGRFELTVRDSDAVVRALVASVIEFSDLTVANVAFEDAVITLLEESSDTGRRWNLIGGKHREFVGQTGDGLQHQLGTVPIERRERRIVTVTGPIDFVIGRDCHGQGQADDVAVERNRAAHIGNHEIRHDHFLIPPIA